MHVLKYLQDVRLRGNIYWNLLLRLLLAMLVFTLCRIGFYLYNTSYFPEMTASGFLKILWGGVRFDMTAVLYINLLIILLTLIPFDFRFTHRYQTIVKYLFFILNGIAIAANLADFIYYKFTLRRTTADFFTEFEEGPGAGGLFFRFVFDYWYVTIFAIAIYWTMVVLYNKTVVRGPMIKNRIVYYSAGLLTIPLVAYLFIGGVRGGFKHSTRPITLSNAGEYVRFPRETNLVLNTPFSIFRTIGKTKIQRVKYFENEEELASVFTPVHQPKDTIGFKAENVVVILLESFSKEFFGAFNKQRSNYTGYTPFLDSLIQHSRTFQYSFSNGRKSIDGPPSALASLPTLSVPFVLTPYANNKFNSLASILGEKGYHTSFFIGHPNGAMGYTAFTQLAGFQHYYGMDEYDNAADSDGLWGIWDHKFLPFFAGKLNEFPQPFFSTLFTVSSHHPFKVPKEFEGRFKGGSKPILQCIEYTDYSLREFFKTISKEPWYKNTLFVFTADHCSSDILFDESRTNWGYYSVPVIFFKPDNSLAHHSMEIASQVDIMPSVLGYLHYDRPYLAFGRNIFNDNQQPIAFNYNDAFNLYLGEYLLTFNGEETVGLYNFVQDNMLTHDLKDERPEVVQQMEPKIKAIIQQYNNRLIENRLTVN
ncbi:MAG TPA: sulfatase-like hydrolase/transferase [Chryseolinea sp.]|nr:sulfatase-like hydrolase/transferase [Chryseolinea sp.]